MKISSPTHCNNKLSKIKDKERIFLTIYHLFIIIIFTLQYCIVFAIHQHESTTDIHVFPILNPPPTSLPIQSLWVVSVHQPQTSCILHRTWTGNSFLIRYYTCFNAILTNHPPAPSPTESKRLFYTSVSLLLSCIQGYRRRQWQPTPVLLPGKSHGRRNLVGCSPWGCTESDTTQATWQQQRTS